MGLLDKINKENIGSINQDIADKYLQLIFGNEVELYQGLFANDVLYINGSISRYHVSLKINVLHDIHNDIKRDFTISSNLGAAIYVDVDSDLDSIALGYVKIKCKLTCQLFNLINNNVKLENINIESDAVVIDLSNIQLSNANIRANNIQIISGCTMEAFKDISGNISTDNLFIYIQKTSLIKSIYHGLNGRKSNWDLYSKIVESNFIELLDPDRFDVNTYCITLSRFINFHITKCPHKFEDPIPLNDTWYFAKKSKNPLI